MQASYVSNNWVIRAAIGRPRATLACWALVIGLLGLRGIGVEHRLHRSNLSVPGAAATANAVESRQFGPGVPLTILLAGPRRLIDTAGPRLVARIDTLPSARTLNPWTPGSPPALRPDAGHALIVLRQSLPFERQSRETVPRLRRWLASVSGGGLHAHLTGAPDVANGINDGSLAALRRAELIAAPLLGLVLLLVFRSPLAALIPLALGLLSVVAARGEIDLVNEFVALDAVSLSLGSMLGLALSIDYALLVVSRFREELENGRSEETAVSAAASTAGHTVLVAGFALLAAIGACLLLSPGTVILSAAIGGAAAALLSVLGATTALPAALTLLGARVNRWRFGRARGGGGVGAGVALLALRRPLVAALVVGALLVALGVPALAMRTGPPDVRTLPVSSPERADYEAVRRALGPGWTVPFDIVTVAPRGTITTAARMRQLVAFQRHLERVGGVAHVFGPASLEPAALRLRAIENALGDAGVALRASGRDRRMLDRGFTRVRAGVAELRAGLRQGSVGARRLHSGGRRAGAGAAALAAGLARARRGVEVVMGGLDHVGRGARELVDALRRAGGGVAELGAGVRRLRSGTAGAAALVAMAEGLRSGRDRLVALRGSARLARDELTLALGGLASMPASAKLDPGYRRAYEAVGAAAAAITGHDPRSAGGSASTSGGIEAGLASAAAQMSPAVEGARRLSGGVRRLSAGLTRLEGGFAALRGGLMRVRAGAVRLQGGLRRLRGAGGPLDAGLATLKQGADGLDLATARLAGGAGRLARGLAAGATGSATLAAGVGRMARAVSASANRTRTLAGALGQAKGLGAAAGSGHMLLATLDGAPPGRREAASFVVNLDRGGTAADIMVIPTGDVSHAGNPLRARLERAAAAFAHSSGLRTYVGGAAPMVQDFDSVSAARLPLLVAGLVLLTYLALVVVFRSLLLPAIAVLLNVATVLAAFGGLALGFQGSAPLGGPGFLDAIIVLGTLGIVFGLSIDYAVFLVARMREGYWLTGSTDGAIRYGVNGTARIITGAATIMSGAFIALSLSQMTTLRQFGVGVTVAVILDATLVRLVLLPALVKLVGPAAWWLPATLDRLIPGGEAQVRRPATSPEQATVASALVMLATPDAVVGQNGNGAAAGHSEDRLVAAARQEQFSVPPQSGSPPQPGSPQPII